MFRHHLVNLRGHERLNFDREGHIFWHHSLQYIATNKSSSHAMGGYRLTEPAGCSREQHDHIMMRQLTEHESEALGARSGVPLAARSRYHGMVSLEKMRVIVVAVQW